MSTCSLIHTKIHLAINLIWSDVIRYIRAHRDQQLWHQKGDLDIWEGICVDLYGMIIMYQLNMGYHQSLDVPVGVSPHASPPPPPPPPHHHHHHHHHHQHQQHHKNHVYHHLHCHDPHFPFSILHQVSCGAGSFTCFLTGFTYTFGEWSPVVKTSFRYSQAGSSLLVRKLIQPPEVFWELFGRAKGKSSSVSIWNVFEFSGIFSLVNDLFHECFHHFQFPAVSFRVFLSVFLYQKQQNQKQLLHLIHKAQLDTLALAKDLGNFISMETWPSQQPGGGNSNIFYFYTYLGKIPKNGTFLGGGNSNIFYVHHFSPRSLGRWWKIWRAYFSDGWFNHQPAGGDR